MPQYVEGPEAKAMESGFALDELLRKERGLAGRQRAGFAFDRGMADVNQANKLQAMVKGEELKEQGAQREAERSAPFLQQLIGGNPNVARAFGFGEQGPGTISREGAMAEPEAMGTPAAITPGAFQARRPTMQEATGLSRAVPGIAQTLLSKSMDPSAGFTLSPGQIRFDAVGNQIAQGGPQDVGMTLEQAQAIKERMEKQDPTNVGRVQLQSHEKGGWTVSLASQTPLTPPDPIKKTYDDMIKSKIDPKVALDWYVAKQAEAAGAKQLQISVNTPPTEPMTQADEKQRLTLDSFNRLKEMSDHAPAMVREFLTWKGSAADLYSRFNRVPGLQYLVGPQGLDKEEFIQRYNEWDANLGRIRAGSFDLGGKQLTPFEDSVVRLTIPTKSDSPEAYQAKMAWMGSYMGAQQQYVAWSRVTPKIAQTPQAQEQAWAQAKQMAGIDTAAKSDWYRKLSPDDQVRLRVQGQK